MIDRLDRLWISTRYESSASNHDFNYGYNNRPWTPEEDKKLLKLYEQAMNEQRPWSAFIAREMDNRSLNAVTNRIATLRTAQPKYQQRISRKRWCAHEDSVILDKLQDGCTFAEIVKYLPGRTKGGINARVKQMRSVTGITLISFDELTDVHIQRAIHMRINEGKSSADVAADFHCSYQHACRLWRVRCVPLLSEKDLDTKRHHTRWSYEELKHLEKLYVHTTMRRSDVALQFPSKTLHAVDNQIRRSQLTFARKQIRAALRNEPSDHTLVLHQKPGQALRGLEQRRTFSSSSYALGPIRHWSADEDRKLLELRQQGEKYADIWKMLEGRSIVAVIDRIAVLEAGLSTNKQVSRTRWSAEEVTTLLEKLRQGLTYKEITQWLPARGCFAIKAKARMLRLTEKNGVQFEKHCPITRTDHQRMIVMRLTERKTLQEIATQFGRSYKTIVMVWYNHCARLLSKEALDSIHAASKNSWSKYEIEHLVKLYDQKKLSRKEIALQFPSRTATAVGNQLYRFGHLLDKSRKWKQPSKKNKPANISSRQYQSTSTARRFYSARPTPSMWHSVENTLRRQFSSSSRAFLKAKAFQWTPDHDRKLLELHRQGLAQWRIAAAIGGGITRAYVERRLEGLRTGRPSVATKGTTKSKWRLEEDAKLIQKKREGLCNEDIAAYLPGRSIEAARTRWITVLAPRARRAQEIKPLPLKRKTWKKADLDLIIDMRVNQRKSIEDIASYFGRSVKAIFMVWHQRCAKVAT